ncbi:MAG: hypothetical protein ACUVV6_05305, partial [Thermoplasmatota archaeon]
MAASMRKRVGMSLAAVCAVALFVASAASPAMSALLGAAGGAGERESPSGRASSEGVTNFTETPQPSGLGGREKERNCSSRADEASVAAELLSVLRGRVYDLESGRAIAGAVVSLQPIGAGRPRPREPGPEAGDRPGAAEGLPDGTVRERPGEGCAPEERPPVPPGGAPSAPPEEPPEGLPPPPPEKPPMPPGAPPAAGEDGVPLPPGPVPKALTVRTDEKG